MQIDRPSNSVSKICHGRGRVSAARTSFSLSFSLFRKDKSPVFPVETCVESQAYQRDHSRTGIQARTGTGRREEAPVRANSEERAVTDLLLSSSGQVHFVSTIMRLNLAESIKFCICSCP